MKAWTISYYFGGSKRIDIVQYGYCSLRKNISIIWFLTHLNSIWSKSNEKEPNRINSLQRQIYPKFKVRSKYLLEILRGVRLFNILI